MPEEQGTGAESAVEQPLIDVGRLGQSFILLGAILLVCYIALFVTSFFVAVEANWMAFNFWSVWRLGMVVTVCLLLIGFGWLLCKKGRDCR
jgi:protein-S-isoprenylcysteine O-methyltransferase Ste14